jgi:hypothetical protein
MPHHDFPYVIKLSFSFHLIWCDNCTYYLYGAAPTSSKSELPHSLSAGGRGRADESPWPDGGEAPDALGQSRGAEVGQRHGRGGGLQSAIIGNILIWARQRYFRFFDNLSASLFTRGFFNGDRLYLFIYLFVYFMVFFLLLCLSLSLFIYSFCVFCGFTLFSCFCVIFYFYCHVCIHHYFFICLHFHRLYFSSQV